MGAHHAVYQAHGDADIRCVCTCGWYGTPQPNRRQAAATYLKHLTPDRHENAPQTPQNPGKQHTGGNT